MAARRVAGASCTVTVAAGVMGVRARTSAGGVAMAARRVAGALAAAFMRIVIRTSRQATLVAGGGRLVHREP